MKILQWQSSFSSFLNIVFLILLTISSRIHWFCKQIRTLKKHHDGKSSYFLSNFHSTLLNLILSSGNKMILTNYNLFILMAFSQFAIELRLFKYICTYSMGHAYNNCSYTIKRPSRVILIFNYNKNKRSLYHDNFLHKEWCGSLDHKKSLYIILIRKTLPTVRLG